MTTLVIDLHSVEYLFRDDRVGPNLKMMKVKVAAYYFDVVEDKYPWEEEFADFEFMMVYQKYNLQYLARLRGVYTFEFEMAWRAKSEEEAQMWRFNMRKFEALVRSRVDEERER